MNNPQVLKIIENLKGRKNYEEKRASKLGFASLYDYIEDKVLKKKEEAEAEILDEVEEEAEAALTDAGDDSVEELRASASDWLESNVLRSTASINK